MDKKRVEMIRQQFDQIVHQHEEAQVEYWLARDLMPLLGYDRWENFDKAIARAEGSCAASGIAVSDHFREVTKMVALGSGSKRSIKDYMLTRYACYLVAQNGDPKKEEIAFAQSYFALQTRKQELIEGRIARKIHFSASFAAGGMDKQASRTLLRSLHGNPNFAKAVFVAGQAIIHFKENALYRLIARGREPFLPDPFPHGLHIAIRHVEHRPGSGGPIQHAKARRQMQGDRRGAEIRL